MRRIPLICNGIEFTNPTGVNEPVHTVAAERYASAPPSVASEGVLQGGQSAESLDEARGTSRVRASVRKRGCELKGA
jgi:hypothetical protein